MDERDLEAEEAPARRFVDQEHVVGLQPPELRGHVVDLEGDVVHPGAPFRDEPPHRRVLGKRTQELDPARADPQGGRLDALVGDLLAVLELPAEEVGVDEDRGVEVVDGDPDVVDAQRHSRSRIAYTSSLCHSPLTHSFTRSASRRMPSFSSTRAEAVLRASSRPYTRWNPAPKAQSTSARA